MRNRSAQYFADAYFFGFLSRNKRDQAKQTQAADEYGNSGKYPE
jgi:hypothetical protein